MWDASDEHQVYFASRTGWDGGGKRFGMWPKEDGRAGKDADAFAVANGSGMAKPVIADRAEAAREDMTEIAPDELSAGNGLGFELVVGAVLPKKGDGAFGDRNDPAVGNHAAGNIVAKIADGMGTGTGRLNVNAPVFGPDVGIDLPIVSFELGAEVLTEGSPKLW